MSEASGDILRADAVTFGYAERPRFLGPIDLRITAGQCWGIIGPNGAGKSTLLRLLAGLAAPASGRVLLDGVSIESVAARRRARRVAFLPQGTTSDLAHSVRDIVLMGRYPHRGLGFFENTQDRAVADAAIMTTQLADFAERPLNTLSGGEAQRAHIAAALAQEPAVFLLDEPTSSLDLYHQISIMTLLRRLADDDGLAVVVVTHDVNLAARYCSHLLLLDDGRAAACGSPHEVMTAETLRRVYGVEVQLAQIAGVARPWAVALRLAEDEWPPQQDQRGGR